MSDPAQTRPVPVVVTARTPLLNRLVPAGEAYQVVLFECLAHAAANIPAVVEAHSSDGLHQLRVGLRRLRTALALFGKDNAVFGGLDARAKAITAKVGPARDLDVFLSELLEPAAAHLGAQRSFEALRSRGERARERAWQTAINEVAGPHFRTFQEDAAAAAKLWADDRVEMIGARVPALMDNLLAKAHKRGRHLEERSPAERHRLRIALKKLRYGTEFFAPLYKKKPVATFLAPLKELQDRLGHLNDVAQVRSTVGRLMMDETLEARGQADLSYAAGLLLGWHQAHAEQVLKKTHKRWKAFRKAEPFWD